MKPNLLIVGNATPRMMERLRDAFIIHKLSKIDDLEAFLKEKGDSIEAIATNGHDGVCSASVESGRGGDKYNVKLIRRVTYW